MGAYLGLLIQKLLKMQVLIRPKTKLPPFQMIKIDHHANGNFEMKLILELTILYEPNVAANMQETPLLGALLYKELVINEMIKFGL